jgi:hypothetical protein
MALNTILTGEIRENNIRNLLNEHCKDNDCGPFLSMPWLTAWLSSFPAHYLNYLQPMKISKNNTQIGFLTLGFHRFGFRLFRRCLLNQANNSSLNKLWIEYNQICCEPHLKDACSAAALNYLVSTNIAEFYISMASELETWQRASKQVGCSFEYEQVLGYRKKISQIGSVEALLMTLSSNTRGKVRKAIKTLSKNYGESCVEFASSIQQKTLFFDELSKLHRAKWEDTQYGSGFENKDFVATLWKLITESDSFACIACVKFGQTILGYTINYTYKGTVYFYCSGINYNFPNKQIRPGYVMHVCLMAEFSRLGFSFYDFMGGDSQYKRSLSSESYTFYNIAIQLPTMSGRLLKVLKAVKSISRKFD